MLPINNASDAVDDNLIIQNGIARGINAWIEFSHWL